MSLAPAAALASTGVVPVGLLALLVLILVLLAVVASRRRDPRRAAAVHRGHEHAESTKAERRRASLAEDSADPVIVMDAGGVITDASPATEALVGYAPETLIGRNGLDLVDPRDRPTVASLHERASFTGAARTVVPEHRLVRADGSLVWCETIALLERDPSGGVRGVRLSLRDVTERREAREALRASEERFRLIAENVADAIVAADAEGALTFVSPSARDIFGAPPGELVGMRYLELVDPRDRHALVSRRTEAVARGHDHFRGPDHRILRPDGREIWVENVTRILRDPDGGLREMQASVRDVTDRHAAEDALRRSEERLRLLADNSGDLVLRMEPPGKAITYASPSAREIVGWTPDQLLGRTIEDLVHPADLADVLAVAVPAIRSGARSIRLPDHRIVRRDGAVVWVDAHLRIAPLDGRVNLRPGPEDVVVQASLRPVGARRRAELALWEETRQKAALVAEQSALRRVATAVAEQRAADEIEMICAEEAGRLLEGDAAGVMAVDGDRVTVRGVWSRDGRAAQISGTVFPLKNLDALAREGRAVRVSPIAPETRIDGLVELIASPVRAFGGPWGSVVVASATSGRFEDADLDRLTGFAELLQMAIEGAEARARLEQRADHDSLTGLLNHRAFHERLGREELAARRSGRPLAVAVIDIDNFRAVNEVHGHQRGDEVIAMVAAAIAANAREGDHVARIGGEEFGWVMPGATAGDGVCAAERLGEALHLNPIDGVGLVTVSTGVSDLASAGGADELLRLADGALYWAKADGRDRVVAYAADTVRELSVQDRAERLERERALYGIRALARAVDARDSATHSHSERVADLTVALAERLGAERAVVRRLHAAALVHDVGKIGVPDAVLLKPGPLDPDEYAQVRRHAALGADIVGDVLVPEQVAWIRSHHERWDGGGYPDGLAGTAIPWGARVMAVADSWDVMTSDRPYRAGLTRRDALAELRRCAGGQFDPEVAAAMIEMVAEEWLGGREIGSVAGRRGAEYRL